MLTSQVVLRLSEHYVKLLCKKQSITWCRFFILLFFLCIRIFIIVIIHNSLPESLGKTKSAKDLGYKERYE